MLIKKNSYKFLFLFFLIMGMISVHAQKKNVKIGLLIPEKVSKSVISKAALNGAELAVMEANKTGGYSGRSFQLLHRTCDGTWGAASNETVDLIFEEEVWAVMASLDGRNAHLAEQVATKGHTVLLCSRASDPTLSQTYIPWFFRSVPDDRQQANALLEEIFDNRKLKRVGTVTANDYDAKMAAKHFAKIAEKKGHKIAASFSFENSDRDFKDLLKNIERSGVESIVIFGPSTSSVKLIKEIRARGMSQKLFASSSMLAEIEFPQLARSEFEGVILVVPNYWNLPAGKKFQQKFKDTFGYPPTLVAANAYDGMQLIIKATRKAGLDREKIRDVLAKINFPDGATGPIHFNSSGDRNNKVQLVEIKNGKPVSLHTP